MTAAGRPYGIRYRMSADGMQGWWWWLSTSGAATRKPSDARRFAGRKAATRRMRVIARAWFEFRFQVRPIPDRIAAAAPPSTGSGEAG